VYTSIAVARTPALAVLDREGVGYRLHEYEVDPRAESYGLEAARKLGLPPERVFKTLVVAVADCHLFAVLPVDARLDTKTIGKRAHLADPADAERITGYRVGGVSPFGQKRRCPVVVDEDAAALPAAFVNAGQRGLQARLAPADLVRALDAVVAAIS